MSATPLTAHDVLSLAGKVLIELKCAFKFAGTLDRVAELISTNYDRAASGKFITAYPDNDDHFRRVAENVHRSTCGLAGPEILSDRLYAAREVSYIIVTAYLLRHRLLTTATTSRC